MIKDSDVRFQRNLDAIEKIVLPPQIRPPPKALGAQQDRRQLVRVRARGKDARRTLRGIISAVSLLRLVKMIRFIPMFLGVGFTVGTNVAMRGIRRVLWDAGFVVRACWLRLKGSRAVTDAMDVAQNGSSADVFSKKTPAVAMATSGAGASTIDTTSIAESSSSEPAKVEASKEEVKARR